MPGNGNIFLGTVFQRQHERVVKPRDHFPDFVDVHDITFMGTEEAVPREFLFQFF